MDRLLVYRLEDGVDGPVDISNDMALMMIIWMNEVSKTYIISSRNHRVKLLYKAQ